MPDVAAALLDALAHHRAGRTDAAEQGYQAVLAHDPDQPNALALYGHLLAGRDDAGAVALLTRAAATRPDDAEARLALGNIAQRAGNPNLAEAWWRAALAICPGHVGAGVNLAGLLRARGAFGESSSVCKAALAAAPHAAPLWLAFAETLLAAANFPAALSAAEATLALAPENPAALLVLGTAHAALGAPNLAEPSLRAAYQRAPDNARAALHLGNLLIDRDQLDEAQSLLDRAVALDPALPEAWTSLGVLLAKRGQPLAATALHRRALALRPDFAEAWSNLAAALLLAGDYRQGFAAYEWRKRNPRFTCGYWRGAQPEWLGEDLAGRTLLVFCEQGLGDALMGARYLAPLAASGARLVLVCAAPLIPLFAGLPGVAALVPRGPYPSTDLVAPGHVVPPHDLWVDMLSLPHRFDTTVQTVPAAAGYLAAPPHTTVAWQRRLPREPRIGLVWAGNPAHSNDRRRSLPAEALAPLQALTGCCFVSLQKHGAVPGWMLDAGPDLHDFAVTAGLLATLDAVVTVDSSVAHLAGAMALPTALLLPHAPDWRWLLGRDSTPWYDSLTLFRQETPGDWSVPIARATAWLRARISLSTHAP